MNPFKKMPSKKRKTKKNNEYIETLAPNAPVKLFCPHPPPPPPGSPGVRENMRVIKKGGALENRVILVII